MYREMAHFESKITSVLCVMQHKMCSLVCCLRNCRCVCRSATIEPILKNGDKKNVANYRPISILPSFSQILEKIIYIRLMNHLETNNINNILAVEQFGFRTSSSTEQASFNFNNNILNEFKTKNNVGGIFFDLQKAFDCVNHDILLNKLEFYGIRGRFFQLIKTYLHSRYQRIFLNNYYSTSISDWGEITHVVPQGSVLGLCSSFYI